MAVLGDIALVGYAADTGGKSLSFVILADISGETLNFTDNGWLAAGGFRSGEGVVSYVVPANTPVGTVVTISNLTITVNPSTTGDQIIAYVGTAASPTVLFALDFADGNTTYAADATNSNTSAVPTGLTFGDTALAFGTDNGAYTGPLTGTRLEILANIANEANWTLNDTTPVAYPANFTVGGGGEILVSINDVTVTEGNAGTTLMTFTVTRTDASGAFSVDFATANGSAAAGSDFVATSGTIDFTAGGALTQTISVTVNGDTASEGNENFTIVLSNLVNTTGTAAIADASGTGTITNDDFNIVAIHDIQGAGHTSALAGQVVTTTGIVTAVSTNGFYLQTADADADANVATSQAILVFTSSAPTVQVGQALNVTGTVSEFIPGGAASNNLSTTQIISPTITVLSSGNPLPTAILLGAGGRQAATEAIDSDNFATFNPATDGIDFYESLEAMLVTVPQPLVVAPTTSFGEIFTVADGGANATGLSARGTIVTRGSVGDGLNVTNTGANSDYNPERIQIDGASFTPGGANSIPLVNTGAVLNNVTGIMSYGFGNFEVLATTAVTVATPSILTGEVTALAGAADTLTIATYNVLNLDPNDADGDTDVADGRFTAISLQIVNMLGSPDIIALQEVQDNSGSANDGTISASLTLQTLINAISASGGPTYTFIDNSFITNNTNGGEPGGNIRVAYLYNAARVSLVADSVTTTPDAAADFAGSRPPLVATFTFNGENVTLINNHFSSKGGSSPLFGSVQPSSNGSAADRLVQAQNVADYVASLDPAAKIVVLGDLNEFTNEESLAPLNAAGLTAMSLSLPATERYSYSFEGNAQQLDQVYVSSALIAGTALDIVHINSEFVQTSAAASDHDPSVIAINIAPPAQPLFGPGDVAFVGFNADGLDNLALVALKALPAGTVLYFTDNEWNGTAFADFNESTFALTLTRSVAAGGLITVDNISTAGSTSSNAGTVAAITGGGSTRGLSGEGEAVYVYLADARTPLAPTAFLAAISNDGFPATGSLAGTGLVAGTTAIDLSVVDPGADIAAFTASRSSQTSFAAYLPVLNNAANWTTQDANGDQSADAIIPDVPFSSQAFLLASNAQAIAFDQPGTIRLADFTVGAGGWTTQDRFPRQMADVNGDGFADIVGFGEAGTWVALGSQAGSFAPASLALANFGVAQGWSSDNSFHRQLADVNNDGRDDVIGFGAAGVLVSLAQANGSLAAPILGSSDFNAASGWTTQDRFTRVLADVNGDGFADIVGFSTPGTFVALGTGTGSFGAANFVLDNFGANQGWTSDNLFHREVGDVNGDGRADIVGFGTFGTMVSLGQVNGTFAAPSLVLNDFGTNQGWASQDRFTRDLADVNGDGLADIVGFSTAGTFVAVGRPDGTFGASGFELADFGREQGWTSDNIFHRELADVNGDGRADIVGFGQSGVFAAIAFDGLVI